MSVRRVAQQRSRTALICVTGEFRVFRVDLDDPAAPRETTMHFDING